MRPAVAKLVVGVCLGLLAIAGCGGSVEIVDVDGGGGSSSGTVSSSSGSTGTGSGSSPSGGSSGVNVTSPQCAGLVAQGRPVLCLDGTTATPFYSWDGTQCVLGYECPPTAVVNPGGPIMPSSSSSSGASTSPFPCLSAGECVHGQVCCAILMGTTPSTVCQVGPCMVLPVVGVAVQLCVSDAECPPGQICGTPTNPLLASALSQMGDKACTAPLDAAAD